MKSKPYLKNTDTKEKSKKTHLKIIQPFKIRHINYLILFIIFLSGGCNFTNPLFSKEKIPDEIIRFCKQDYNIDVKTKLADNAIWVYMPFEHLINNKLQIDDDVVEKLNNISLNISRALLNTKNPPDFYVLVASDINLGADYFMTGYVLDIMKYQMGFISKEDFINRHVIGFKLNPKAIADKDGNHIETFEISLVNFLLEQITQRIQLRFTEADMKDYFKIEPVKATFENKSLKFYIDIKKAGEPKEDIDITKEVLKIAAFVIRNYDFNDFLDVEISDLNSGKKIKYGRLALNEFK